ncbi:MAG: hypothetical protein Q8L14_27890 [Myxococcales bacterium]|nr:hypothetical protein [Myxococcales bacterium]
MGLISFILIGVIAAGAGEVLLLGLRMAGPWLVFAIGATGGFVGGMLGALMFDEPVLGTQLYPLGLASASVGAGVLLLFLDRFMRAAPATNLTPRAH